MSEEKKSNFDYLKRVQVPGTPVKPPYEGYVPGRDLMRPAGPKGLTDAQIDDMHYLIINRAHETLSTMREEIFVKFFLPVFAAAKPDNGELAQWVHGANGFDRRVSIVDNMGRELFQVPPILSTSHITVLPRDDNAPTFTKIASLAAALSQSFPARGQGSLHNNAITRMRQGGQRAVPLGMFAEEWRAILERYGYKLNLPNETSAQTNSVSNGSSTKPAEPRDDSAEEIPVY